MFSARNLRLALLRFCKLRRVRPQRASHAISTTSKWRKANRLRPLSPESLSPLETSETRTLRDVELNLTGFPGVLSSSEASFASGSRGLEMEKRIMQKLRTFANRNYITLTLCSAALIAVVGSGLSSGSGSKDLSSLGSLKDGRRLTSFPTPNDASMQVMTATDGVAQSRLPPQHCS